MPGEEFYVVTGMPIDKVQQYKNATYCQKRYAKCFDTNNNGIFDKNEVDLFNATTFSQQKDNTVIFYTQVKEKKWFFPSEEKVAKKFNDDPNKIRYSKNNEILKNRKIIPYKETHYSISGISTNIGGIKFSRDTAEEYQEIFFNNQYMNSVKLKHGTIIIYPNGQKGSVDVSAEHKTERVYGYTTDFGWDMSKSTYTVAGEGGLKWHDKEIFTGNYIVTCDNLKNTTIFSADKNIYKMNNCKNTKVEEK